MGQNHFPTQKDIASLKTKYKTHTAFYTSFALWRLSFKSDTKVFHRPGTNKEIPFKQLAKSLYLLAG